MNLDIEGVTAVSGIAGVAHMARQRGVLRMLLAMVTFSLLAGVALVGVLQPAAANAGGMPPASSACTPLLAPGPAVPGAGYDDYQAGWNLISGYGSAPSTALGPLYTYNLATGGYDSVAASSELDPAHGYWAYFPCPVRRSRCAACTPVPLTIDVQAGQYTMIGNPSSFPISTSQSDVVIYVYDPVTGYRQVTTLGTGQGAWVYSAAGTTLRLR